MEVLRRGVGLLRVCDEVAAALHAGKAVVALESTIISHGMPYPQNVETALKVEETVRQNGAVPATVAIIDSKLCVGLSHSQIDTLGKAGHSVIKASRRDMAAVIAEGKMGATTVAGTMIASHAAGIPIFVTGGLGGVHRGGEVSMDISADLTELGRTPVAVVCAGVKSILDIGRTLEFLETQGVTVATLGPKNSEFPAFFSSKSGHASPYCFPTVEHCARVIDANQQLGLGSGLVLGVPIPAEHDAGAGFEALIEDAIAEATRKGIAGKEITPFLLQRVNELTKGRSLTSNIGLVMNNARVGAQIAVSLADLRTRGGIQGAQRRGFSTSARWAAGTGAGAGRASSTAKPPLVVGGATVDIMAHASAKFQMNTTTYGSVQIMHGGVGRNIAEALHRLGGRPRLATVVGDDAGGAGVVDASAKMGMDSSLISQLAGANTAAYNAFLNDQGALVVAVGDMAILQRLDERFVSNLAASIEGAPLVCVDGNVSDGGLRALASLCRAQGVPLWFEGTSTQKVLRPITTGTLGDLCVYKMSFLEFCAVTRALLGPEEEAAVANMDKTAREFPSTVIATVEKLSERVPNVVVTLGELGVVAPEAQHSLLQKRSPGAFALYPPASPKTIVNVTGAGDSMMGGLLAATLRGLSAGDAIRVGTRASQLSLESMFPVSPSLSWQ